MIWRLLVALRALWHWNRLDSELDEEIQFHLAEEAAERESNGASADEARAAARRDFGNVTLIRERTRDVRGWTAVSDLLQDLRHALRIVRLNRAFSLLAILTLALGIGAMSAIVSVVSALLLRPLPFPDDDRLVVLFATTPARGIDRDTTSFLDFSEWRARSDTFTQAAAWRQDSFNITGGGTPESVPGLRASSDLLAVLGTAPALGRMFDAREQHENQPVALIGHALWTRRFGGDSSIIGRTITLNESAYAVIGVLPSSLQFPPFQPTEIIVPVPERACRSCGYLRGIARLRANVETGAAQRELDTIAAGLAQSFPDSNEGRGVNVVPLPEVAVGVVRPQLLALLGAAAFVLIIGCGNVGNLVLARGLARSRELALRAALGAGSGRLVRQLLTESLTLSLLAATLGIAIAYAGSALLVTSLSQRYPLPPIALDWSLVAVAVSVALIGGILSGLPSSLMVWRSAGNALGTGRGESKTPWQSRLGNLLVVTQTALTVTLLLAAGLLLRSYIGLQRIEPGLDARHILTADLPLSKRYADPERRAVFQQRLLDDLARLPGVKAVAAHTDPPFLGGGARETFVVEGMAPAKEGLPAAFDVVTPDFFDAIGLPIARGRAFDRQDSTDGVAVVVVNETLARRFWPGGDALGKRLRLFYDKDPQRWLTIVGIARDVRYRGRLVDPVPQVFVPAEQNPYRTLPYAQPPFLSLVVNTAGDPATLSMAVQARLWEMDREQPVLHLQPLDHLLWVEVTEPRIYTLLVGAFAIVALTIAAGGIYGLGVYTVVRRTREIGVRLAIGATPHQVLALVIRHGMLLMLSGVAIGVAASLALTSITAGFLHGVTPTDGPTFAAVLLLFLAVACASTYLPARRAARVDPAMAFRSE